MCHVTCNPPELLHVPCDTVVQVAQELIRTFVTPSDRVRLILSDDTEKSFSSDFVFADDDVKEQMLQLLTARASKARALFATVKADLQAAFHLLDSADDSPLSCVR